MDQPVVIVTGASRGLGAATARQCARLGARVVLAARSFDQQAECVREIEAAGGNAVAVRADISREEDCRAVVEHTLDQFGHLDALVNNSGVLGPIGFIAQADAPEWERNWAVNLLGPVLLTRLALPFLRPQSGRIVNITSGAAANVIPGWGAYSISKAALNLLTQILAQEEPEVTTLALRPGVVDTEMQAHIRAEGEGRMEESNYRYLSSLHKQGRLLPPEVPARAIACLALYAPPEWSGEILQWDDPQVQQLVRSIPAMPGDFSL